MFFNVRQERKRELVRNYAFLISAFLAHSVLFILHPLQTRSRCREWTFGWTIRTFAFICDLRGRQEVKHLVARNNLVLKFSLNILFI